MAISGDMVLSQNQIEFSKKGLVPYEVIELRANQVYLKLGREVDAGVYMRIGPIKRDHWRDDHYQMEVAYYETRESLFRFEEDWEGSSSWGVYLKKVEMTD